MSHHPLLKFSQAILAAATLLISVGCAHDTTPFTSDQPVKELREQLYQLEEFTLSGKLGFRNDDEAFSVAVNNWLQKADYYQLDLSSTFFGLGAVRISGSPSWIEVQEPDEEPVWSNYPNETIEQLLGFPLPVQRIRYWIRGIPAPQSEATEVKNLLGLTEEMQQDGWTIQLDRYRDVKGLPLPGRIKVIRDDTKITLAVASWAIL